LSDIVLGKTTRPDVVGKDQDKFDGQDREAMMLLKLSMTDEMLPEVQTWEDFCHDLEAFERSA
jgi:hypothetical protein